MLSHRLRTVVAIVPALALAGVVVASPSLAAPSMRITSPMSGTTVAGTFDVTGTADGVAGAGIDVALAPQAFGDCGAAVLERTAVVDASGGFAASMPSAAVADGVYCVIVVMGDGRMSTSVGDITVRNSSDLDESLSGTQLPTEPLGDQAAATSVAALGPIGDVQLLAPAVLGAAATLALVVLALALVQRRRTE